MGRGDGGTGGTQGQGHWQGTAVTSQDAVHWVLNRGVEESVERPQCPVGGRSGLGQSPGRGTSPAQKGAR